MLACITRLFTRTTPPCPTLALPAPTPSEPTPLGWAATTIRVQDHVVPPLRRAAGIGRFDLIELLTGGHFRSLRERALGSTGAWATTPESRAALANVARDLHLLVFDPEREAFIVVYAQADPQAARLCVTRVTSAQQYEQAHLHLLPIALYRALCAQSIASSERRERILTTLGQRDLRQLPILFALEHSRRDVWVEITLRNGREKRLGILPFALKQQRAADLPALAAFWDWVQFTRAGKAPIDRSAVASVRLLGWRDPFDARLILE